MSPSENLPNKLVHSGPLVVGAVAFTYLRQGSHSAGWKDWDLHTFWGSSWKRIIPSNVTLKVLKTFVCDQERTTGNKWFLLVLLFDNTCGVQTSNIHHHTIPNYGTVLKEKTLKHIFSPKNWPRLSRLKSRCAFLQFGEMIWHPTQLQGLRAAWWFQKCGTWWHPKFWVCFGIQWRIDVDVLTLLTSA